MIQVHRKLYNKCRSAHSRFNRRPLILLYHRVASLRTDPWGLAIDPRHFEEHLDVITSLAHPISLDRLLRRERLPVRPVVITFDDGNEDNARNAWPLLQKYTIPFTTFVLTGSLDGRREFWWDELERLLLTPGAAPCEIQLNIAGCSLSWNLDVIDSNFVEWRAWEPPPTLRHSAYVALYGALSLLPGDVRHTALETLREQTGLLAESRVGYLPLSSDDLRSMTAGQFMTIGAHTVTHPVLAKLDATAQRLEIEGSKQHLEFLLDRPVNSFAYPYGKSEHYTKETVDLVRQAGFGCACSNFPGLTYPEANPLEMPRWSVSDCDGDQFEKFLSQAWAA